jgi:hypothetical protein
LVAIDRYLDSVKNDSAMKPKCPLCQSDLAPASKASCLSVVAWIAPFWFGIGAWYAVDLLAGVAVTVVLFIIVAATGLLAARRQFLQCPNCGRQERISA